MRACRTLLVASLLVLVPLHAQDRPAKRWFRGNTHTHTLWSDGDAAPEWVVQGYKERGYDFLVLSEHNVIAEGEKWAAPAPEHLAALAARFGSSSLTLRERRDRRELKLRTLAELDRQFAEPGRFLLLRGEEITDKVDGLPVHQNVLNVASVISPTGGRDVADALARTAKAVDEEAARSGRPLLLHVNHPNYGWAITGDDLLRVPDARFFEVYNGHPSTRSRGDARHPSTEQLWDFVLARRLSTQGAPLLGLATDDAHNYLERPKSGARPFRGWVMVRAGELTADAITRALLAGDFYASTGVRLEDVRSDGHELAVTIAAEEGVEYTTSFVGTRRVAADRVGEVGAVLAEVKGPAARYRFDGSELYVRARIVSSRLHPHGATKDEAERAWTQPVVPR